MELRLGKREKMLKILNKTPIFLKSEFDKLDNIINNNEIQLFNKKY